MLRYTSILLLITLLFSYVSCSDVPLGSETNLWESVTSLPRMLRFTGITARNDGAVFISSTSYCSETPSAVYKYENGVLSDDFVIPCDWSFNGINSYMGCVFTVGTKKTSGKPSTKAPYMVHNSGAGWVEIPVEVERIDSLRDVFAINETDCWVLASDAEDSRSVIMKYVDGKWTRYDIVNNIEVAAYCPLSGVLYIVCNYGSIESPIWKLVMTGDGGKTWVLEELAFDSENFEFSGFYGYEKSLADVPGALYINAAVESNGVRYDGGVVKRTGPPGEGTYEPLFFSRRGPYFWDIRSVAFKDEHNGIAVGHVTSVVYNDPDWVLEDVTQEHFIFERITIGPDGYWAIACGDFPGYALMYHP